VGENQRRKEGNILRQDEYKHYRATEKRLYTYRIERARQEVLLLERMAIMERIMPSVGVVAYSEHIGRTSGGLTEAERYAEQGLKDSGRMWLINRELDDLDARCHILNYAVAVLSNVERDIVKARYFDGFEIERVAELCRYSDKQCRMIRNGAIRKIGAVLYGE